MRATCPAGVSAALIDRTQPWSSLRWPRCGKTSGETGQAARVAGYPREKGRSWSCVQRPQRHACQWLGGGTTEPHLPAGGSQGQRNMMASPCQAAHSPLAGTVPPISRPGGPHPALNPSDMKHLRRLCRKPSGQALAPEHAKECLTMLFSRFSPSLNLTGSISQGLWLWHIWREC